MWPTKDENSIDIPSKGQQEKFYVNPYSGDLSLKFPRQEQSCLGGILADGTPTSLISSTVPCFANTIVIRDGSGKDN